MAIAYELCEDVAGIKGSLCVLCDNEEHEISEFQLSLINDK